MIEQVKKYLLNLQNDICEEFGNLDSKSSFDHDVWERDDGRGSGITRVISNGSLFEKGGVNFSIISGDKMPKSATQLRPELEGESIQRWAFLLCSILKIHLFPLHIQMSASL